MVRTRTVLCGPLNLQAHHSRVGAKKRAAVQLSREAERRVRATQDSTLSQCNLDTLSHTECQALRTLPPALARGALVVLPLGAAFGSLQHRGAGEHRVSGETSSSATACTYRSQALQLRINGAIPDHAQHQLDSSNPTRWHLVSAPQDTLEREHNQSSGYTGGLLEAN